MKKVSIDSGEYLREYNWGTTTNYLSIYTSIHVETTRLACDVQPSISQLYYVNTCVRSTVPQCAVVHALAMYWACVQHVSLNLIILYIEPNIGMIRDKIR